MALSQDWRQRILMLCAMYAAQGLPWGFMVTALIAYLTERGLNDGDTAKLTGIILLPWTFKLIWGPVIDTFTIRSMGRRRPWIIGSQFMMALTLLGIIWLGDPDAQMSADGGAISADYVWWLGIMFFVHNCFASLQDVSTDALAVDVLPPAEQGRVNGLMWGAKLFGKALGGVIAATAMSVGDDYRPGWGIPLAVLIQIVLLIGIMLFPLCMLERPGEKRFPWSKGTSATPVEHANFRNPIHLLRDLIRGFALVTTSALFVYGVVHVLGWGIVEVFSKTLYTQQLGWTSEKFSYAAGFAAFPELFGALAGGFVADRWGRRIVMVAGFGVYGAMHLLFAACPMLWDQTWFSAGYLVLNPGALAMGSVGFLSTAMNVSWTRAAATMFTIYMTLSNVGHVAGNYLAGWLRGPGSLELSYETSFAIAGLVTIVPLALVAVINPATVIAREAAEREKHSQPTATAEESA